MRVAIYTQHFVGVGHHVRSLRVASAFARSHQVRVFDGGRPFHGAGGLDGELCVQLPAVIKGERGLEPFARGESLDRTMQARTRLLGEGLRALRPELLVVESFPFSRWAFREEIFGAMRLVRALDPGARIACSIRDVPRASQAATHGPVQEWDSTRGRPVPLQSDDDHLDRVPDVLNEHFDALLVHGDPNLTRLEDHFPWVPRLSIPVHYTGYVCGQPVPACLPSTPVSRHPLVVVSVGGGVDGQQLLSVAAQAWGRLAGDRKTGAGTMVLFGGAFMDEHAMAPVAEICRRSGAILRPFSTDFEAVLAGADLSISRAGYNTVVALLAAGVRAIVLPSKKLYDQSFRAPRLHERGLAVTCEESGLSAERLAGMIADALARPAPRHRLDLDGARTTVRIAEALVAGDLAGAHAISVAAPPAAVAR